jgi:hypothetical protein
MPSDTATSEISALDTVTPSPPIPSDENIQTDEASQGEDGGDDLGPQNTPTPDPDDFIISRTNLIYSDAGLGDGEGPLEGCPDTGANAAVSYEDVGEDDKNKDNKFSTRLVTICLVDLPFGEDITVTLASLTDAISLSGTFSVFGTNIIWSDPIRFPYSKNVGAASKSEDKTFIKMILAWPANLPDGDWMVSASSTTGVSVNGDFKVSGGNKPQLEPRFNPDLKKVRLVDKKACPVFDTAEAMNSIEIVGTGFISEADVLVDLRPAGGDNIQKSVKKTDTRGMFSVVFSVDDVVPGRRQHLSTGYIGDLETIAPEAVNCFIYVDPLPELGANSSTPESQDSQLPPTEPQTTSLSASAVETDDGLNDANEPTPPLPAEVETEAQQTPGNCLSLVIIFGLLGGTLVMTRAKWRC